MKPKDVYQEWEKEALNIIAKAPDEIEVDDRCYDLTPYKVKYSEEKSLQHYRRTFYSLYNDLSMMHRSAKIDFDSLLKAAFLHAIQAEVVGILAEQNEMFVNRTVIEILHSLEVIDSYLPKDMDDISKIFGAIIRDNKTESILIFIYENYDHIDPDRTLMEWTKSFALKPRRLPSEFSYKQLSAPSDNLRKEYLSNYCGLLMLLSEYIGLWNFRNSFGNACLYFKEQGPDNMGYISYACSAIYEGTLAPSKLSIETKCRREFCNNLCKNILKKIADAIGSFSQSDIYWEWHHPGSIERESPECLDKNSCNLLRKMDRLAMVTVLARDVDACYFILGKLHRAFVFRPNITDYIGKNKIKSRNSYKALHTTIEIPAEDMKKCYSRPLDSVPVKVRILTDGANNKRNQSAACALSEFNNNSKVEKENICVYSPAGEVFILPLGALVINYASKVHNHFVNYVSSYRVNNKSVDMFHPLKNGDVVEMEKSSEFSPLPTGWEMKVPQQSVESIRNAYVTNYKSLFYEAGERFILSFLKKEYLFSVRKGEMEKTLAHVLCKDEGNIQKFKSSLQTENDFIALFIRSVGMREYLLKEYDLPQQPQYPLDDVDFKLSELADRIFINRIAKKLENNEEVQKVKTIVLCPKCNPDRKTNKLGYQYFNETKTIVFHNAEGSYCTAMTKLESKFGNNEIGTLTGIMDSVNYDFTNIYYIKVKNKSGVARNVLRIFAELNIDVYEISARKLGDEGYLRIVLDDVRYSHEFRVGKALLSIDGIQEICRPGDDVPGYYNEKLPPIIQEAHAGKMRNPHLGWRSPVEEKNKLYGREKEWQALWDCWNGAKKKQNTSLCINGTTRTGKSSLGLCFVNSLKSLVPSVFACYYECYQANGFGRSMKKLMAALNASAEEYFYKPGSSVRKNDILYDDFEREQDFVKKIELLSSLIPETKAIVLDELFGSYLASQSKEEKEEWVSMFEVLNRSEDIFFVAIMPTNINSIVNEVDAISNLSSKMDLLTMNNFSRKVVGEILQLKKEGLAVNINIDSKTIKAVWDQTLGLPFWVKAVAEEMWKLEQQTESESITFTERTVTDAVNNLLTVYQLFETKLPSNPSGVCSLVLDLFSISPEDVLAEDEIIKDVIELDKAVQPMQVKKVLSYLKEIGTVVSPPRGKMLSDENSQKKKYYSMAYMLRSKCSVCHSEV